MTVSIKKWGNSLAVRLPKDVAQSLEVENDSKLDLRVENGKLILTPRRENDLPQLLEQITSENLHKEIETGEAVGHENW